MFAAETELRNAQKVKEYLIKKNLFHPDYLAVKELGLIYFPIIKKVKVPHAKVVSASFSFSQKQKNLSPEELLKGKLTASKLKLLPKSQEIVGKILILEIPEELHQKERIIAEAYLKHSKNVETVAKKADIHEGDYRLRKVKVLAGKNTKETIHHENGIQLKLHLEKTYFSARLANERLRIAKQVKCGEKVLVMFSGAAPYPLVIAKHSPAGKVYGIEINPWAHQYALENVRLNNLQHKIVIREGDVRRIVPSLQGKFDRIVMPLPKTGEHFLDVALQKARSGTVVHLYAFLQESEIAEEKKKIKEICAKSKHPVRIVHTAYCGQYAPYTFRVCFDLKVL